PKGSESEVGVARRHRRDLAAGVSTIFRHRRAGLVPLAVERHDGQESGQVDERCHEQAAGSGSRPILHESSRSPQKPERKYSREHEIYTPGQPDQGRQQANRAADRLNMSQPPLSQRIMELERELQVTLFERTRRRVELTAVGGHFLESAREVLARLDAGVE